MKELPIPFTAAMVRAVRAGRKTQTRRLRLICAPGDRLWVREAYSGPHELRHLPPREWPQGCPIWYWADGDPTDGDWTKPKPPMFMCRWMSRMALDVTEVRGHQLATITEAEILAEGIEESGYTGPNDGPLRFHVSDQFGSANFATAPEAFTYLWDGINGKTAPVSSNPYVWAYSFEVAP
jgi:hypothetical protein